MRPSRFLRCVPPMRPRAATGASSRAPSMVSRRPPSVAVPSDGELRRGLRHLTGRAKPMRGQHLQTAALVLLRIQGFIIVIVSVIAAAITITGRGNGRLIGCGRLFGCDIRCARSVHGRHFTTRVGRGRRATRRPVRFIPGLARVACIGIVATRICGRAGCPATFSRRHQWRT